LSVEREAWSYVGTLAEANANGDRTSRPDVHLLP
jgi:hypothetical protein